MRYTAREGIDELALFSFEGKENDVLGIQENTLNLRETKTQAHANDMS